MQVLILGSGTSFGVPMIGCDCEVCRSDDPRDNRTRAAVLIRAAGRQILVDAPPDLRQQMLRHGVARLDAVLMTHAHADHIFGLDDLRAFSAHQQAALPVYGDAETLRVLRKDFDYAFADQDFREGWIIPRLDLREWNGPAQIAGVPVAPVPILHGGDRILGYRVGDFAYLTDCSGVPEESMPLLEGLDALVVGAVKHDPPHPKHFSVRQALELIELLRPRRAWLTHISHRLGHSVTEAQLPAHVRLAWDGLVID